MFNKSKIDSLTLENASLKEENSVLQREISDLKSRLTLSENALNEKKEDFTQDEIVKLLLESYADGIKFLQGTVEGNLVMLLEVNDLNNKIFSRTDNLQEQTLKIVNSAESIQNMSGNLRDDSSSLNESVISIADIINLIKDISDQTNLLALNAAIEAARAGEHGRGFAVVADEVRKLAERTQKATQEVEVNISGLKQSSTTMSEMSQEFIEVANNIMSSLDEFKTNIEFVNTNSRDILNRTLNITNETQVSNGKIDHINMKLEGYKAAILREHSNIPDHTGCRFGKWYAEHVVDLIKEDSSALKEIAFHHENVHTGLLSASKTFLNKSDDEKGLALLKDVENSSKKGFEILLDAIKRARK